MRAASGSNARRVNGRQSAPLLSHSTPSTREREILLVSARTGGSIEEREKGEEGDEKVEKEPGENNKLQSEWCEVDDEDDGDDKDGKEGRKLRQRAISSGEGLRHNESNSNTQQLNGTLPTIRLNSLPTDSVTDPIKGKRSYFLLYREPGSSTNKSPEAKLQTESRPSFPSLSECKLSERLRQLMEARPRRSFTKPYAAKTVFFFKDGDEYFTGLRVPVSKARFRTMDALLDTLNQGITLPFGVRRLHTPSGRTQVNSLEQLKHLGKYVASSSKVCRRPPPIEVMEERERGKQKHPQLAHPPRQLASTFSGRAEGSIRSVAQSARRTHATNLTFLPVQAKQMFFVLNGHPSRIYRALINPLKASARGRSLEQQGVEKEDHDLSSLLDEISRGLQVAIFRIYSFDGERVLTLRQLLEMKEARALAVPRNERPMINGQTHSDIFFRRSGTDIVLPSILNSMNSTASNTNTKSSRSSSSSRQQRKLLKSSQSNLADSGLGGGGETSVGNSIEKPTKDFSSGRNGLSMLRLTRASPSLMSPLDEERENAKAPNFLGDEEAAPSTSTERATRLPHLETRLIPRRRAALGPKRKGPAVVLAKKKGTATQKTEHEAVGEQMSTDVSSPVSLLQGEENKEYKEYKQTKEIAGDEDHLEELLPSDGLTTEARRPNSESKIVTASKLDLGSISRRVSIDELIFVREIEALKLKITNASDELENAAAIETLPSPNSQPEAEVIGGEHAPATDRRGEEGVEEIAVELKFIREEDRGDAIELRPERAVLSHGGGLVKTDGLPVVTEVVDDSKEKHSQVDQHEEEEMEKGEVKRLRIDYEAKSKVLSNTLVPLTPQFHSSADPLNNSASPFTYTITVVTGNRWAADTEADLHVIIYGERQLVSQNIYLRQEHINWLQIDAQHRFRQNQADSFRVELPTHFGIIEKIVIGHENTGYGGGVFIDRVLITEEENLASAKAAAAAAAGSSLWHQNDPTKIGMASGGLKQYLFDCSKWFDSGQVDGRVERTLKLTAYADLNPPPPLTPTNLSDEGSTQGKELEQELLTKGRWELLLLVGKPDHAGSTSGLAVVGYGTSGQSKTIGLYDSRISEKGESSALIQVDFGNIGELLKVRVEIDGAGAVPDLFLRRVEFKDLDTGERFTCICAKWLKWWNTLGMGQGGQPFRELSAFHIGIEPLSVITYECKMHVMPSRIPAISNPLIHVEIYGDLGETGLLPVTIGDEEEEAGDIWEVDFKLEASSVGRVYGARIYFQPTKLGAEIYEGFITLSDIFKKHALEFAESAVNWLVSSIVLRESRHAPYRYLLRQSRVGREIGSSYNDAMTILAKEVLASEMEGVSTKASKKKGRKRTPSSYILSMLVGEGSTHYPDVTLCGKKGHCIVMTILNPSPSDGIISYQLKSAKIGELTKVRVSGNQSNRLALEAKDELKNQNTGMITTIHKIRLCDTENGDELRFPNANIQLTSESTYEFAAIWPDCPPTPIVSYIIKVPVVRINVPHWNDSQVKINIHGEAGSTGFRLLKATIRSNSPSDGVLPSTDSFEFEAVSVGKILKVEARMDPIKGRGAAKVELGDIVVVGGTATSAFKFKFDRPLTSSGAILSSERQLAN